MAKLLRKAQQPSDFADNQIHDAYSTSTTDTYSCNYINNGLMQSGSNANGSWIKFADGTMICYFNGAIIPSTPNNEYTDIEFTFPIPFISTPTVIPSLTSDSTDYNMGHYTISAPTQKLTLSGFAVRFFNNTGSNRSPSISYIAIGKWK